MDKVNLVCHATVVTMDAERRILSDGAIAWSGERILDVGKSAELMARYPQAERIDATGCIATPGFVDAHNHPAHFLTKGLFDDIEPVRRWRTRLYPFECAVSEEETYWGALGTFAEMLIHGTTCVADPGNYHPQAVARAAERIGIRIVLTGAISDTYDPMRPISGDFRPTPEEAAAYNERLFLDWNGAAAGRIRVAFGLWTANSVSDELCVRIRDHAERHGAVIHGHLVSRPADNEAVLAKWGCRAVVRYHRLGLIRKNFVAAHMGAIDEAEVDLFAKHGASVVHCPSASMLGAFGCISHGKFPELDAAGVNLALGSDAAAISRFLDMPRLMYLAACAHKDARMDAEVMGAHRAMVMGTVGGARAFDLDEEIGSLEAGKRADFCLLRAQGIEWQPRPALNPVANLVYSSGGYRTSLVVVDGRTLVSEGRLLSMNEHEIVERAAVASRSAAERAGIPEVTVWPVV